MPGWVFGFISVIQKQRNNTCSGKALSLCSKVVPGRFNSSDGDGWDAKGIVFVQKAHIINSEYAANMLKQLRKSINKIRLGKLTKGALFYLDKSLVHKFLVSRADVSVSGVERVDHFLCSPDLAVSDYDLIPNTEKKNTCSGTNTTV